MKTIHRSLFDKGQSLEKELVLFNKWLKKLNKISFEVGFNHFE